jgi:hypothetical protein
MSRWSHPFTERPPCRTPPSAPRHAPCCTVSSRCFMRGSGHRPNVMPAGHGSRPRPPRCASHGQPRVAKPRSTCPRTSGAASASRAWTKADTAARHRAQRRARHRSPTPKSDTEVRHRRHAADGKSDHPASRPRPCRPGPWLRPATQRFSRSRPTARRALPSRPRSRPEPRPAPRAAVPARNARRCAVPRAAAYASRAGRRSSRA